MISLRDQCNQEELKDHLGSGKLGFTEEIGEDIDLVASLSKMELQVDRGK